MLLIRMKMTRKQAEKLSDVLSYAQDKGPVPHGWASDELEDVMEIVERALRAALEVE